MPTSNHKWRARVRLMGSLGVGTPAASRSHFYASSYPRGIASTCTRPDCLSQRWSKEGRKEEMLVARWSRLIGGDRNFLKVYLWCISGFTIISFIRLLVLRSLVCWKFKYIMICHISNIRRIKRYIFIQVSSIPLGLVHKNYIKLL